MADASEDQIGPEMRKRLDGVCIREAVTSMDKRLAIFDVERKTARVQEAWASQFSCPNCGRCTYDMVNTAKVCTRCGESLFRLAEPLVTDREAQDRSGAIWRSRR